MQITPKAGSLFHANSHVAQFDILRLRLIKVAARVVELKTMIKIHLPTAYPAQDVLSLALTRIPRLVT